MDVSELVPAALDYSLIRKGKGKAVLPGLSVYSVNRITDFEAFIYDPVICLILQGSKQTTIGDQMVSLPAGHALVVSHDLPVRSKITEASAEKPYLALILSLDLGLIRGLYDLVGADVPIPTSSRSLSSGPSEGPLNDAMARYLALRHAALDAQVLGPSIMREIHFRLLMSPMGGMLANMLSVNSHASRIAKAIARIRADYRKTIVIPALAESVGMSASSFHGHFKDVTGATPLQYQKDLRMIAARDLLRSGQHNVSSASYEVGYESPTHFSRDYQRKFGLSPSKEQSLLMPA